MTEIGTSDGSSAARGGRSDNWALFFGIGLLLHLAAGWLILVGGLVMPPAAVVALAIVWAAALVWLIMRRSNRLLVLLVPAAVGALYVLLVTIGDAVFGWTA